ncbi:MAG: sugar phosphate isomerase/epimerase [Cyclobacteriaceae bacterium]|nr:sugar phosphate isomerase/epimerase [Cyclobacteriaceae bacterium]
MKRRDFIQRTAGAAMLMGVAPDQLFGQTAKGLTKKSLKFGMIQEEMSVLDKFKLVKELGFHGIELDSPNELNEQEILDARDQTGLEIPGVVNSVHWKKPLSHPDPEVRAACTESMIDALHKCKLYGGTTVLLVPAVVNEEVGYDEAWDRSTEEIKKMLPAAEETGVKIAIENVWNNFLISPLEAAHYIDQFDSNMIGWYFDVGNVIRYGWPDQWVRILGKRILKIDVKEYSREKQKNQGIWEGFKVKLGEGDSDWPKVNKALVAAGYEGWGSAEVPGGDRERLWDISRRMDRIYNL